MSETIRGTCLESARIEPKETVRFLYERSLLSPFTQSLLYFGRMLPLAEKAVLKVPKYQSQLAQEWTGSKRVFEANLPVPEPLGLIQLDGSDQRGMVFEYAEGAPLYQNPDPGKRANFGKIVQAMHSRIPVMPADWINNERSQLSHYEKVRAIWEHLDLPDNDDLKRSIELYDLLARQLMDQILVSRPSFLHGDLHDGQVIHNNGRMTLFDFGMSREAQALQDLAIYCHHTLRTKSDPENIRYFLTGYFENTPMSESDKQLLTYFLMYTALRSVEWYAKFLPQKIDYPLNVLPSVNQFVEEETVWKQ